MIGLTVFLEDIIALCDSTLGRPPARRRPVSGKDDDAVNVNCCVWRCSAALLQNDFGQTLGLNEAAFLMMTEHVKACARRFAETRIELRAAQPYSIAKMDPS